MSRSDITWKNKQLWNLSSAETLVWACFFYSFPALIIEWRNYFEWSVSEISFGFTLALLAAPVFGIYAGKIIDNGHGKILMVLSSLLGGIFLILLSLTESLLYFYIIWIFIGISMGGCLYPPCFSHLTYLYGTEAKRPIFMVTLLAGLAGTVSFPVCRFISSNFDWQTTVIFLGVVSIIMAAPLFAFSPSKFNDIQKRNNQPNLALVNMFFNQTSIFWLLFLIFTLTGLSSGMIISHIFPALESREVSTALSVLLASLIGPSQVTSRLIVFVTTNMLGMEISISFLMTLCLVVLVASSVIFTFGEYHIVLIFLFVVFQGAAGGLLGSITPIIASEYLGIVNFGILFSLVGIGSRLGTAVGPSIGGYISTRYDYDMLFHVTAILLFISFIIFNIARKISNNVICE
jgi:MFS family permease